VAELLARISSRELAEWMAYFEIDPFGEERADLRAGIVASTVANSQRGRRGTAFKPKDFMPKFGQTRQSAGQQLDIIRQLHQQWGGE